MPRLKQQIISPTRREAIGAIGFGAMSVGALALGLMPGAARAVPAVIPEKNALTEDAVLRDPDIPVLGNADGDITIVNYFDYNCPYCRKVDPELQQVVQDDGKVRLVFKDWAVLGPVSVYASRMAIASKFQDKYQKAHDVLISTASRLTEPGVRERLASTGIDVDRAVRDLDTNKDKVEAIMARNAEQAKAFGFRGTPAFIIGKFRVPGVLTIAQFEQAIGDARKAAAKKS